MTKETTHSLRQMLVNLDATYRVHTRLYKLNHALYFTTLSNLRAAKNNSIGMTGTIISVLLAIITMAIGVLGINPSSAPMFLIYAFILIVAYLGYLSCREISKAEVEFEDIIGPYKDKRIVAGIETWIDFTLDEISKFSTRISIIKKILKDEELESNTKKSYENQLKYYTEKLGTFKSLNEELYNKGLRKEQEHNMIKKCVEDALGMEE